ncbi:MAG: metal-dependent transcriptional regulator, partial [Bacillota bacterium]
MGHADEFYTLKGYARIADGELTSAMEDYLEMIARLTRQSEQVRVNDLSKMLHVKASSVTKMIQQLGQAGFVQYKKYGDIDLTDKGREIGEYLLYRH